MEVFSSLNLFISDTHFSAGENFGTKSNKGFNSLNLGVTYQVKKEDERPSLLLGSSITTIERVKFTHNTKNAYFKGYNFFATSYYTVDPVVFLLKASYGLSLKKSDSNSSVKNGNIFVLSPQIYFAVNPYTSMSWGVRYSYHDKSKMDGVYISASGSDVTYLFGTSYEISAKSTINIDLEYSNTISSSRNNIAISFSYKL